MGAGASCLLLGQPGFNTCFSFAPELVSYWAPSDLHRRTAYSICESSFLIHHGILSLFGSVKTSRYTVIHRGNYPSKIDCVLTVTTLPRCSPGLGPGSITVSPRCRQVCPGFTTVHSGSVPIHPGGVPVYPGPATVMPRCLLVLKMLAIRVNRDTIGVNRGATGAKRG